MSFCWRAFGPCRAHLRPRALRRYVRDERHLTSLEAGVAVRRSGLGSRGFHTPRAPSRPHGNRGHLAAPPMTHMHPWSAPAGRRMTAATTMVQMNKMISLVSSTLPAVDDGSLIAIARVCSGCGIRNIFGDDLLLTRNLFAVREQRMLASI